MFPLILTVLNRDSGRTVSIRGTSQEVLVRVTYFKPLTRYTC